MSVKHTKLMDTESTDRCISLWQSLPKDLEDMLQVAMGLIPGDRKKAFADVAQKYPDFNPFIPRWLELPAQSAS